MYPGVGCQIYPNQASQNGSSLEVLLLSSTLPGRARASAITIHLDPSRDKVYWRNFSLVEGYAEATNGSCQLSSESLPVMLYDLDRFDLGLLEQGARVEEILLLWNLSSCIGLESDPAVLSTALEALEALGKGNATLCNSVLGSLDDVFPADLIAMASEYVKQAPPAQATYEVRHGLETAADYWDRGSKGGAKHYLMDSLARMCAVSVREIRMLAIVTLLVSILLAKGRGRISPQTRRAALTTFEAPQIGFKIKNLVPGMQNRTCGLSAVGGAWVRHKRRHLAYHTHCATHAVPEIRTLEEAIEQCEHEQAWKSSTTTTPQDIAEGVAFLCSEAARFISGCVLTYMMT